MRLPVARRWLLLLGAALLLLGGAVAVTAVLLPARVRSTLEARGCTAGRIGWHGPVLRLTALSCAGLRIAQADLRVPTWDAVLTGMELEPGPDLAVLLAPPTGEGGSGGGLPGWLPGPRQVTVEDLDVRLGEALVVRDLRGTLLPPRLDGPDTRVVVQDTAVLIEHRLTLDGEPVAGALALRFVWDVVEERTSGSVEGSGLTLSHPLLADRPLAGLAVQGRFEGTLGPSLSNADLTGTLAVGGPEATWRARLDERGAPSLDVELPDAPAATWLAPLTPVVPELAGASVEGTLGGSVAWNLERGWSIRPRIDALRVSGAVPAGLDLRWGPFTTTVLAADGERVPRRTGEGTPGWTPIADVSPDLVHAVLAAEDAAFFQHAGYDPAAIQAALDADLEAGEVLRGGSTLTQQLAKNLFLDGQQTLARKVRELLLAVELDRTLGKDRVLELYLNVVELGPDIYGVGQACDVYLMKSPARITPLEAAFLAALLPSPRPLHQRWYVEGRPERARIDAILDNMVDGGWLGVRAAERWKAAPLVLVPPPR